MDSTFPVNEVKAVDSRAFDQRMAESMLDKPKIYVTKELPVSER